MKKTKTRIKNGRWDTPGCFGRDRRLGVASGYSQIGSYPAAFGLTESLRFYMTHSKLSFATSQPTIRGVPSDYLVDFLITCWQQSFMSGNI